MFNIGFLVVFVGDPLVSQHRRGKPMVSSSEYDLQMAGKHHIDVNVYLRVAKKKHDVTRKNGNLKRRVSPREMLS